MYFQDELSPQQLKKQKQRTRFKKANSFTQNQRLVESDHIIMTSRTDKKYNKFTVQNSREKSIKHHQSKQISHFISKLELYNDSELQKKQTFQDEDANIGSSKHLKSSRRRKCSISQSDYSDSKKENTPRKTVIYEPQQHKQINIDALKNKRHSYKNLEFKKKNQKNYIEKLLIQKYESMHKKQSIQQISNIILSKGHSMDEGSKKKFISMLVNSFDLGQQNRKDNEKDEGGSIRRITQISNQHDDQSIKICNKCAKLEQKNKKMNNIMMNVQNLVQSLKHQKEVLEYQVFKLKKQFLFRISQLRKRFPNISETNKNQFNSNPSQNELKKKLNENQLFLKEQSERFYARNFAFFHFEVDFRNCCQDSEADSENKKLNNVQNYFRTMNRSQKSISEIRSIGKIVKNFGVEHKFKATPKDIKQTTSLQLKNELISNRNISNKFHFRTGSKPPSPNRNNQYDEQNCSVETSFLSEKPLSSAEFYTYTKKQDILNFTDLHEFKKPSNKKIQNSFAIMQGALAKLNSLCYN